MSLRIFPALILAFAAAACMPQRPLNEEQKAAIAGEVEQTLQDYFSAVSKRGLEGEFHYLDSSADFFWVPPGYSMPLSYTAVKDILASTAPHYASIKNVWDTLRVTPLTERLAAYTGTVHSTMTDNSGNVSRHVLVETGLMIRRRNGWKLLNGQTNLVGH